MEQKMRSDGSCEIVAGQAFKQEIKPEVKGMVV